MTTLIDDVSGQVVNYDFKVDQTGFYKVTIALKDLFFTLDLEDIKILLKEHLTDIKGIEESSDILFVYTD